MLPQFPHFKKLELGHRKDVEKIISQFPPYSDYNFTSIWSYNVEGDMEVATLHDNLILSFRDYITNDPFHSFIGVNKIAETVHSLLSHVKTYKEKPYIKLIPEIVVVSDTTLHSQFNIVEDVDNHDYIVSLDALASTTGKINSDKRREINKLHRLHKDITFKELDLADEDIYARLNHTFHIWTQKKNYKRNDVEHEFTAIQRLLKDIPHAQLVCIGVFKSDALIAFSISEVIGNQYAIGHFMKADFSHDGVYEYIRTVTAAKLQLMGCKYLNCEQDLGKPGLRQSKLGMKPTHFLKKYIISPKY